MLRICRAAAAIAGVVVSIHPAQAEPPDAASLLAQIGFTPAQIAEVESGKFVSSTIQPSSEREIVAAFAFEVKLPPAELVKEARAGLLDQVDPNTLAFQMIAGTPTLASFGKLTLEPGAQ